MSENKKHKTLDDKIEELKKTLVANSNDKKWAEEMLVHLISLQKQADVESVELVVPCKEVKKTLDFGSWSLKRTIRGILFEAKGGLSTFVEMRMTATYGMLNNVFDFAENPSSDPEQRQIEESYRDAVAYIMQSPIFASISEECLFGNAAEILRNFNEYTKQHIDNAKLKEETEEDIMANDALFNASEAVEEILKTPLPPDD